jgi:two-component system phosphate regulon response regulator PhoB
LTPTEFRLLEVFRQRRRHGFTRAELAALVMPDAVVLDRTIDVHVKSLRRKLAGGRERIETVYGVGYRLVTDESS